MEKLPALSTLRYGTVATRCGAAKCLWGRVRASTFGLLARGILSRASIRSSFASSLWSLIPDGLFALAAPANTRGTGQGMGSRASLDCLQKNAC